MISAPSRALCTLQSWQCPYHAELGLQLDLQGLHGALELGDLTPAALHQLAVGSHLTVQLRCLQTGHRTVQYEPEIPSPGQMTTVASIWPMQGPFWAQAGTWGSLHCL